MAVYGGGDIASGNGVTSVDTANIAVTGTDLAIVAFGYEATSSNPTLDLIWDPAGNNEQMTAFSGSPLSVGTYIDAICEFLDDPTSATAPVRLTSSASTDLVVAAAFATAAGAITSTDVATDSFATTGTALDSTVPNVVTDDLVVDFIGLGDAYNATATATADSPQTDRGNAIAGNYMRGYFSTQAGSDGGAVGWTLTNVVYGGVQFAVRIPDAGGGAAANPKGVFGHPFTGPFGGPI